MFHVFSAVCPLFGQRTLTTCSFKTNPVLLYLHGGPGSSTSTYDYAFTRKWADVYTVVTWDQRNCGKSYSSDQNDTTLTYDLMMSDGIEMTKILLDYLGKDKITLLGHSWGTYFGCNLVLEYPEYYECYIGTGQLVDFYQNEIAFREKAIIFRSAPDCSFNLNHCDLAKSHVQTDAQLT